MTLEDIVIATLQSNLEKRPQIKLESRLLEDLLLDSFDRLMILSALEDEFSIIIPDEDFADVVTVRDIAEKLKAMCPEDTKHG